MGQEGVGLAVNSRRPLLKQLRFQLRWGRYRSTLASANPLKARWPPSVANGQPGLRSRRSWVRIPPGAYRNGEDSLKQFGMMVLSGVAALALIGALATIFWNLFRLF